MSLWEKIRLIWFLFILRFKKGLKYGSNLVILGKPIIDIRDGAHIEIGHNVTLNSRNIGYHLNMHSPVKLFANINSDAIIKIGDNTRINGSCIHAKKRIEIGQNCLIAANCHIFDCNSHQLMMDNTSQRKDSKAIPKPVIVEDDVWICANSLILPGVTIGKGSVVGAGSVVTKSVLPYTLVAGNPAKLIEPKSNSDTSNLIVL